MNILGTNFATKNTINGVNGPAIKGNTSEADQKTKYADGILYQMNNNKGGDSFSYSAGSGNALFASDAGDNIKLKGNWTDTGKTVHDDASNIDGKLYTDDKGDSVVVSGGAKVDIDNTAAQSDKTTSSTQFDPGIKKVETNGGSRSAPNGVITKAELFVALFKDLLANPNEKTFSPKETDFWTNVLANFSKIDVDNGNNVGGDNAINSSDLAHAGLTMPTS
jgi:hypothetical protein